MTYLELKEVVYKIVSLPVTIIVLFITIFILYLVEKIKGDDEE